mmetsp:Transcript_9271/g.11566  ORF Transcript_9271/g.11566 Transcript_9271/m.11566 type:complete len:139 (-) Transcript_9271:317-733(-)
MMCAVKLYLSVFLLFSKAVSMGKSKVIFKLWVNGIRSISTESIPQLLAPRLISHIVFAVQCSDSSYLVFILCHAQAIIGITKAVTKTNRRSTYSVLSPSSAMDLGYWCIRCVNYVNAKAGYSRYFNSEYTTYHTDITL